MDDVTDARARRVSSRGHTSIWRRMRRRILRGRISLLMAGTAPLKVCVVRGRHCGVGAILSVLEDDMTVVEEGDDRRVIYSVLGHHLEIERDEQ